MKVSAVVVSHGHADELTRSLPALDPQVAEATRNIQVQSTLANPSGALRPGMFVRVKVELPGADNVLAIPETAVLSASFGARTCSAEKNPVRPIGANAASQRAIFGPVQRPPSSGGRLIRSRRALKASGVRMVGLVPLWMRWSPS